MSASRIPTDRGMEPEVTSRTSRLTQEEERNKSNVRRLLNEIWGKWDENAVDELYAPTFVDHTPTPGTSPNREGVKQSMRVYHKAFPDSRFSIDEVIAEGDDVACRFSYTGTHKGELFGMPATGKRVSVVGLAIGRLENGKIVESWELVDQQKLMEQLGMASGTQPSVP
jgi:steroid delta-isomerase-like uncharacterized protein